ncbi:unnamed protein product [Phytophthora fragariaefolia]|uniref:Unnamed protein product n=1 Tax=Phytophthora fragariaefolia TaxID=1490495 RepID=A0A9W6X111_9STRA|nr:unnamed protein product [Phytophthora fragariaefolia]
MVVNTIGTPVRARSHASSTTSQPRNPQRDAVVVQGAPPSSAAGGSDHAAAGGIVNIVVQIAAVGTAVAMHWCTISDLSCSALTSPIESKNERKSWNEAYLEFADRLLQRADAPEGGNTLLANARCALVAFGRNAYPKHIDFLETKTDLESRDQERDLMVSIEVLSHKASSDGQLPYRTKHKANAEANAAVIERKKKHKNLSLFAGKSGIVCFECGGVVHTAAFHRKYPQNKSANEGSNEASAQLATVDSSEEAEAVDTAVADVDDYDNEGDE